jgi:hypothetical protein
VIKASPKIRAAPEEEEEKEEEEEAGTNKLELNLDGKIIDGIRFTKHLYNLISIRMPVLGTYTCPILQTNRHRIPCMICVPRFRVWIIFRLSTNFRKNKLKIKLQTTL